MDLESAAPRRTTSEGTAHTGIMDTRFRRVAEIDANNVPESQTYDRTAYQPFYRTLAHVQRTQTSRHFESHSVKVTVTGERDILKYLRHNIDNDQQTTAGLDLCERSERLTGAGFVHLVATHPCALTKEVRQHSHRDANFASFNEGAEFTLVNDYPKIPGALLVRSKTNKKLSIAFVDWFVRKTPTPAADDPNLPALNAYFERNPEFRELYNVVDRRGITPVNRTARVDSATFKWVADKGKIVRYTYVVVVWLNNSPTLMVRTTTVASELIIKVPSNHPLARSGGNNPMYTPFISRGTENFKDLAGSIELFLKVLCNLALGEDDVGPGKDTEWGKIRTNQFTKLHLGHVPRYVREMNTSRNNPLFAPCTKNETYPPFKDQRHLRHKRDFVDHVIHTRERLHCFRRYRGTTLLRDLCVIYTCALKCLSCSMPAYRLFHELQKRENGDENLITKSLRIAERLYDTIKPYVFRCCRDDTASTWSCPDIKAFAEAQNNDIWGNHFMHQLTHIMPKATATPSDIVDFYKYQMLGLHGPILQYSRQTRNALRRTNNALFLFLGCLDNFDILNAINRVVREGLSQFPRLALQNMSPGRVVVMDIPVECEPHTSTVDMAITEKDLLTAALLLTIDKKNRVYVAYDYNYNDIHHEKDTDEYSIFLRETSGSEFATFGSFARRSSPVNAGCEFSVVADTVSAGGTEYIKSYKWKAAEQ
jgi:hypothetical protein